MVASPFAFFRGAAVVMAADLAQTPRTGITAQICGDAHLVNFGLFGTPERCLVFDVNDFDETLPGAVGMGRQAARRQPRDRGARERIRQARSARHRARGVALLSRDHGAARRPGQLRGVVCAARHRILHQRLRQAADAPPAQTGREGRRQGAPARQRPRARQADRGGRRRTPHRQSTAADRAASRRRRPGGGARRSRRSSIT